MEIFKSMEGVMRTMKQALRGSCPHEPKLNHPAFPLPPRASTQKERKSSNTHLVGNGKTGPPLWFRNMSPSPTFVFMRKSSLSVGELYFFTATIHKWKHLLAGPAYKEIVLSSFRNLSERGPWMYLPLCSCPMPEY